MSCQKDTEDALLSNVLQKLKRSANKFFRSLFHCPRKRIHILHFDNKALLFHPLFFDKYQN